MQKYPEHGQRFTGEPAYFKHITSAATRPDGSERGPPPAITPTPSSTSPTPSFPSAVASMLGFTDEQIKLGLLSPVIGNTYAGAAMIGLTAVLDMAKPGDRILVASYGSGAGSDAFDIRVTERITERQKKAPYTQDYIARRTRDRLRHLRPLPRQPGYGERMK